VIVAEREGFADCLANDWHPWQAVVKRQMPEKYEQTQEKLVNVMDEEFSTCLQAHLQKNGLENNPDAQREMGPVIQAKITSEIRRELTANFLLNNLVHHVN
jgi:hypothetical protein